jgi:hypothetical protein
LAAFGKTDASLHMLIFLRHELAFLATPKTGSTAIEFAMRPHAEIIFARNRKHIPAQRYKYRIAPFLRRTFKVSPQSVAIMRDPVDQIRSWYRYRCEPRLKGHQLYTGEMSFEDYAAEVCLDDPPPRAQLGSQHAFLSDADGAIIVDHVFAYDQMQMFLDFASDRVKENIWLKAKNVSPEVDAPLSARMATRLRASRAHEFALYDRIVEAGGHLQGG